MQKYQKLELEIDWEDRPRPESVAVPRSPAVPAGLQPSTPDAPPASSPRPVETDLDGEWDDSVD